MNQPQQLIGTRSDDCTGADILSLRRSLEGIEARESNGSVRFKTDIDRLLNLTLFHPLIEPVGYHKAPLLPECVLECRFISDTL